MAQTNGLNTARSLSGGRAPDEPPLEIGDPGADVPVSDDDSLTVIKAIEACFKEAEFARRTRIKQGQVNWYTYLNTQDWSGKVKGQSREFIPKTNLAVEQLASFVRKSMVSFGNWFLFDISESWKPKVPFTADQIANLLQMYLDNLPDGNNKTTTFAVKFADGVKVGLLKSLIIFKIYGSIRRERVFRLKEGKTVQSPVSGRSVKRPTKLKKGNRDRWMLNVDLVRPEDYYPDPSGRGLYEIHYIERDIHEIIEDAEDGLYDLEVVMQLHNSMMKEEQQRLKDDERAQDRTQPPAFRKKAVIKEYWGTILNSNGHVAHRNCVAATANGTYLIRKPEPNPFWHGESPFVSCPLMRVPFSVWHKAIFDAASPLNLAMNEIFNLILDGGIAAVWGIKQIRGEYLTNPEEVAGGIAQGMTLSVKSEMPTGVKVLENVSEGQVPSDAMAVMEMVSREFEASALTNELKMGQMPGKEVKAAEVMAVNQGQSITLEGVTSLLEEECMERVLRKSWLTILQDADLLLSDDVVQAIGAPAAITFRRMSKEARFALMASIGSFKVFGLSYLVQMAQQFQKIAAMLQIAVGNPFLFQAFQARFSANQILDFMMKALNISPQDVEKSAAEQEQSAQEWARTGQAAGMLSGGQQPGSAQQGSPERSRRVSQNNAGPQLAGQVNQAESPATGMPPNG